MNAFGATWKMVWGGLAPPVLSFSELPRGKKQLKSADFWKNQLKSADFSVQLLDFDFAFGVSSLVGGRDFAPFQYLVKKKEVLKKMVALRAGSSWPGNASRLYAVGHPVKKRQCEALRSQNSSSSSSSAQH